MHESNSVDGREPLEDHAGFLNLLLAAALLFLTFAWLIGWVVGWIPKMRRELGPHLPTWFPVVNLVLTPVTCALAGLRAIPFRAGFFVVLVFVCQVSLLGLSAENHPIANALVMVFLYYEAFVLVPRWNRRFVQATEGGSVLGIHQKTWPLFRAWWR